MFKRLLLLLILFFSLGIFPALASIGVGINNGKIVIKEKLKPGAIYKLPNIIVFNTGTELSDYEVNIQYNEKQTQLKPDNSWFTFTPNTFTLPARGTQSVTASLTIPLNAPPGDYFAYVDAHPLASSLKGMTSIGVAAGAKLYFTVIPANMLFAIYYRLISLFTQYAPWSYIIVSSIIIILLGWIIGKKVKINIGIRKK